MKEAFKTKTDRNGNTYTLEIDHDRKTFSRHTFPYSDNIIIGKRDLAGMVERLKMAGYSET